LLALCLPMVFVFMNTINYCYSYGLCIIGIWFHRQWCFVAVLSVVIVVDVVFVDNRLVLLCCDQVARSRAYICS